MKRSYLMSTANRSRTSEPDAVYDAELQMSVLAGGGRTPVVETQQFIVTEKKTAQAPGDDDPDPDDIGCY